MHWSPVRILAALLVVGAPGFLTLSASPALADERMPVQLKFEGRVNNQPFACGERYMGIGTTRATVVPMDFRLYVSNVALVSSSGTVVPVELEQDSKWQYQSVALLDFENKQGPCSNGTPETRDVITGSVPLGDYTGVRFDLGVPFELNHQDSTVAPSPLNLTSMFWTWQAGYKFLRSDLRVEGAAMPAPMMHGEAPAGHGGAPQDGWAVHLGSTGCAAPSQMQQPNGCANPNRPSVELMGFNPAEDVVVADLGVLLAGTNVEVNQPESAFGCMSAPNDQDCTSIMGGLGLPFAEQMSAGQTLFHLAARPTDALRP